MWFFPYIFRAFRLQAIWNIHLKYLAIRRTGNISITKDPHSKSTTYFIKPKNLIKWFLISMSPFFVVCLLSFVWPGISVALPFFGIAQCSNLFNGNYYYHVM